MILPVLLRCYDTIIDNTTPFIVSGQAAKVRGRRVGLALAAVCDDFVTQNGSTAAIHLAHGRSSVWYGWQSSLLARFACGRARVCAVLLPVIILLLLCLLCERKSRPMLEISTFVLHTFGASFPNGTRARVAAALQLLYQ